MIKKEINYEYLTERLADIDSVRVHETFDFLKSWAELLEAFGGVFLDFDLKSMSVSELDSVRDFDSVTGSLRWVYVDRVISVIEDDKTGVYYDNCSVMDRKRRINEVADSMSTSKYGNGYTTDLKIEIRIRDGNRCLNPECNGTTTKLVVHHIDYDGYNNDKSNLITICRSCNVVAKRTSIDSEWWTFWYQAIMYRRGNL